MVEDRCVQEMHIEVRCAKEFRVKVLLVKGVCAKLCKSGGDRVVRESAVGESACVCVCVNSCARRTSQAPSSFVSVILQPSSMLLEIRNKFDDGNPQRRRRRYQKRMVISEKHALPVAVCISASRISKNLDHS